MMHTSKFIPMNRVGEATTWKFSSINRNTNESSEANEIGATSRTDTADTTETDPVATAAYQRGLKQGLSEGFRAGAAQQAQEQIAMAEANTKKLDSVIAAMQQQFTAMDRDVAHALTNLAFSIARQVVRHEITTSTDAITNVVREALSTLASRASQPVIYLHPDDASIILTPENAEHLVHGCVVEVDNTIHRGGCRVVSDIATVDATLEARWQRALQSMGYDSQLTPAITTNGDARVAANS
jgi:flagellar assembly protein FliH